MEATTWSSLREANRATDFADSLFEPGRARADENATAHGAATVRRESLLAI